MPFYRTPQTRESLISLKTYVLVSSPLESSLFDARKLKDLLVKSATQWH